MLMWSQFLFVLCQDFIQCLSMMVRFLLYRRSFGVALVVLPPLHPARVSFHSFLLDRDHAFLDRILLIAIDRARQHLVTLLYQNVIDFAVLAANVVDQEVSGLEGKATEETLEALHQVEVLFLHPFVEMACAVAVQGGQSFGLGEKLRQTTK